MEFDCYYSKAGFLIQKRKEEKEVDMYHKRKGDEIELKEESSYEYEVIGGYDPYKSGQEKVFEKDLDNILDTLRRMLKRKNEQYGDSALNPIRLFSNASPKEQILVRIDDKISRLARGEKDLETEDIILDLAGYCILSMILEEREKQP